MQIEYDLLPISLKRSPEKVLEQVKKRDLEIVAVAVTFEKDTAYFSEKVGGKIGTLCLFEKNFETAAAKTKELSKLYAGFHNVILSAQPHVRSNVESIEQTKKLLEYCAPYEPTLTFDTAHLTALGVDLEKFIDIFGKKISMVHLKDLKGMKDIRQIDFNKDFVDISDGIVDFPKTLKALKKSGYDGWLVVEVDAPQESTVFASIRKNFERLSKILP